MTVPTFKQNNYHYQYDIENMSFLLTSLTCCINGSRHWKTIKKSSSVWFCGGLLSLYFTTLDCKILYRLYHNVTLPYKCGKLWLKEHLKKKKAYLLPEFDRFVSFPRCPYQRHFDPGTKATRESPHWVVFLTVPHEYSFIWAGGQRTLVLHVTTVFLNTIQNKRNQTRRYWCTLQKVSLPFNQITELGKQHVTDGTEVLFSFILTEL